MSDETYVTEEGEGGPSPNGYHSYASYLKCPRKHSLEKLKVHKTAGVVVPAYFTEGTLAHAGRATFLARGSIFNEAVASDVYAAMAQAEQAEKAKVEAKNQRIDEEALPKARQYITEYMDYYRVRARPSILATEQLVEHDVLIPKVGSYEPMSARLDDVGFYHEAGGRLCIGECKTTSGRINDVVAEYTLHPQILTQQWLYNNSPLAEAYGPIQGTMLDIIKKGYKDKPCEFHRHYLPYNAALAKKAVTTLAVWKFSASAMGNYIGTPNYGSCTVRKADRTYACEYRDLCLMGKDARLDYVNLTPEILAEIY